MITFSIVVPRYLYSNSLSLQTHRYTHRSTHRSTHTHTLHSYHAIRVPILYLYIVILSRSSYATNLISQRLLLDIVSDLLKCYDVFYFKKNIMTFWSHIQKSLDESSNSSLQKFILFSSSICPDQAFDKDNVEDQVVRRKLASIPIPIPLLVHVHGVIIFRFLL